MDPFLYQYGIGGLVFFVGMVFAFRQDYLGTSGQGLRNVGILVGGLLFFAALQGFMQYAPMSTAPAVPYTGDGLPEGGALGTTLDYVVMAGYFALILVIGVFFGQKNRDTKDFFFGGQRFSWWLIAFSLVATTVGSASFVKYSRIAYNHGLASSQTYLNDWFWLPLLLFGWLPILYFTRLTSIPEYFEHRFGASSRRIVTALLLFYLIGYVGVNLFTMGKALNILLGWPVFWSAVVVATVSAIYVTVGGQTSVIMTDLFQGFMLLATGLVLLALGAAELGGFDALWTHLPRTHRQAFPDFNADPSYSAVGVFWQDAMANSAMFYFLNQGILMRFMAARSVEEGRKAAVAVLILLMPVAAVVVASGGWVGRAFVHAGVLPPDIDGGRVFFVVAEMLAQPGVFGLVMAALTAALMSTVDTLTTAVAAIIVNDVVRPLRPEATEEDLLLGSAPLAVGVAVTGVSLVPVFMQFESIYAAHGAFTAAITPPMVVALLLGVFWRRFTPTAANATMIGGAIALAASIVFPELVAPFAQGVPATEVGDGLFDGAKQYKYMRAFYGIVVSAGIGLLVTAFTRPRPVDEVRGYVWGTIPDALRAYLGREGAESASGFVQAKVDTTHEEERVGPGELPSVQISRGLAAAIEASDGSMVYIADRRPWLGGFYATHGVVTAILDGDAPLVVLGPRARNAAVPHGADVVRIQRLY